MALGIALTLILTGLFIRVMQILIDSIRPIHKVKKRKNKNSKVQKIEYYQSQADAEWDEVNKF